MAGLGRVLLLALALVAAGAAGAEAEFEGPPGSDDAAPGRYRFARTLARHPGEHERPYYAPFRVAA